MEKVGFGRVRVYPNSWMSCSGMSGIEKSRVRVYPDSSLVEKLIWFFCRSNLGSFRLPFRRFAVLPFFWALWLIPGSWAAVIFGCRVTGLPCCRFFGISGHRDIGFLRYQVTGLPCCRFIDISGNRDFGFLSRRINSLPFCRFFGISSYRVIGLPFCRAVGGPSSRTTGHF